RSLARALEDRPRRRAELLRRRAREPGHVLRVVAGLRRLAGELADERERHARGRAEARLHLRVEARALVGREVGREPDDRRRLAERLAVDDRLEVGPLLEGEELLARGAL